MFGDWMYCSMSTEERIRNQKPLGTKGGRIADHISADTYHVAAPRQTDVEHGLAESRRARTSREREKMSKWSIKIRRQRHVNERPDVKRIQGATSCNWVSPYACFPS